MFYYQVLIACNVNQYFTYYHEKKLVVGTILLVSFGKFKKKVNGIIIAANCTPEPNINYKNLEVIENLEPFNKNLLDFLHFFASYNLINLGNALKIFLHITLHNTPNLQNSLLKIQEQSSVVYDFMKQDFNHLQSNVLQKIKKIWELNPIKNILLHGQTGSGKTEIFLKLIEEKIGNDHETQILILVPEIALTLSLITRIEKKFNLPIIIWNSNTKKRKEKWLQINLGKAQIILGTRSALFLPFKNLKFIVIDEEHDSSFKQNQGNIYNGRDMAIMYAHFLKIPVLLSSATPSLETWHNAQNNKYALIELLRNNNANTRISIIKNSSWQNIISDELICKMHETLHKKEQILLFMNRKGYANLFFCDSCGKRFQCEKCSVLLTRFTGRTDKLLCRHCGFSMLTPHQCPECNNNKMSNQIPGIDQISLQIKELFPEFNIETIHSNTKNINEILEKIKNHEIDIIIGTQIIAKGHNFPFLTLVAILDLDFHLMAGDLRSLEHSWQLLKQVSGRVGRFNQDGEVILQTRYPQSKLVASLQSNDDNMFYNFELEQRQISNMPPFSKLVHLLISHADQYQTTKIAKQIVQEVYKCQKNNELEILGPTESILAKINNQFRQSILIKHSKKNTNLHFLKEIQQKIAPKNIKIDIDPIDFL